MEEPDPREAGGNVSIGRQPGPSREGSPSNFYPPPRNGCSSMCTALQYGQALGPLWRGHVQLLVLALPGHALPLAPMETVWQRERKGPKHCEHLRCLAPY